VRDIINGVCYQRYEKRLEQQQKCCPNVNVCVADENLEKEIKLKSVFDYRFNSNKHTHIFLFVTQTFWVFIVRIRFFWCAIRVYLKSLNGSP